MRELAVVKRREWVVAARMETYLYPGCCKAPDGFGSQPGVRRIDTDNSLECGAHFGSFRRRERLDSQSKLVNTRAPDLAESDRGKIDLPLYCCLKPFPPEPVRHVERSSA
jgi:hypothetical protein